MRTETLLLLLLHCCQTAFRQILFPPPNGGAFSFSCCSGADAATGHQLVLQAEPQEAWMLVSSVSLSLGASPDGRLPSRVPGQTVHSPETNLKVPGNVFFPRRSPVGGSLSREIIPIRTFVKAERLLPGTPSLPTDICDDV